MTEPIDTRERDALLARLDNAPLTRRHVLTLGLCALAFAFDLMEIGIGGALSAWFSAAPHAVSARELAWLLSSVYIGAIIGAPVMGKLADRVGRRRMLVWLLVGLAVTSTLAAISQSVLGLSVARALSGLALGSFPPLMIVFLTDFLPARRRGPAIFIVSALAFLGAPTGIFLVRWLTPLQPLGQEAWRWVFWLGALGAALLAVAMARWVPESVRWLLAQGRVKEARAIVRHFDESPVVLKALAPVAVQTVHAGAAPSRDALEGGRGFLLLALLYFLAAWSTVAFPVLSGAMLMAKGIRLSDTLLYVGVTTFGPVVGNLVVSRYADALERRTALAGCVVLILLAGLGFATSLDATVLMVCGLLVTLVSSAYVPLLNLYGAEAAGAANRSGMVGGAWAFNRLGAALSPLLLLPMLRQSGVLPMFLVMALSLVLSLVVLMLCPKGRSQRGVA